MAESREDIVSSIAELSESIREKVDELKSAEKNSSDSEEAEGLIKRGNRLQKKWKQKKPPPKKAKRDPVIQIHCFRMKKKLSSGHSYVRDSPMFEVNVLKSDTYSEVISKISPVVEVADEAGLRLFTAGGSVISDTGVIIGGMESAWTVGSYLTKKKISSDKLKLGLGSLGMIESGKKVADVCKATEDDVYDIYYCEKDSVIPCTRKDVWLKIGGEITCFDKYGIYRPEEDGFSVSRIIKHTKGNSCQESGVEVTTDILKHVGGSVRQCFTESEDGKDFFTSYQIPCLRSTRVSIPLIVVAANHPACKYNWICIENPEENFPNSPVLFVNKPFIYTCSVIVKGRSVLTANFDVSLVPSDEITVIDSIESSVDISAAQQSATTCETVAYAPGPKFGPLQFSDEEVAIATNGFDKANEIGKGGFGNVFKATDLRCEGTYAAVKVLSKEGCKAFTGFSVSSQINSELEALMKFRHPNILTVMGFCFSKQVKAIIYEFMQKGSLYEWIHHSDRPSLAWFLRSSIIKDMFRGVAFLHQATPPLIHQDIKSHNILLDDNFSAKIGDFGFALEIPQSVTGRTLLTAPLIARTEGYYPPEILTGKLSTLSDVYSCGVVTVECFTGLPAFVRDRCDPDLVNEATFTEDDRSNLEKFLSISDKRAEQPVDATVAEIFLRVSNDCFARHSKRPAAKQVLLYWDNCTD